jgi:hypothetical membrane protein
MKVSTMLSSRWKREILTFCLVSFAVYALFNPLAMLLYPGGTSTDPDAEGYSFLENFFSDLGMVHTYGGEPKVLSLVLFASALVLMGMAYLLFFAIMPGYFVETRLERVASRIGSVAGVLAGVSCLGIAATPWDLFLNAHLIFAFGLSTSFLLAVLCYSVAIWKNRRYPNAYAAVFAVYVVILAAYLCLMLLGPDISTREGLVVTAVGQKIAIYSGMLCWFAQFLGALEYHRRTQRHEIAAGGGNRS